MTSADDVVASCHFCPVSCFCFTMGPTPFGWLAPDGYVLAPSPDSFSVECGGDVVPAMSIDHVRCEAWKVYRRHRWRPSRGADGIHFR